MYCMLPEQGFQGTDIEFYKSTCIYYNGAASPPY